MRIFFFFLFNSFFIMLFMASLWALDIGVSGMLLGGFVSNGFWVRSPIQQYHFGLISVLTAFSCVVYFNAFHNNIFLKKEVI